MKLMKSVVKLEVIGLIVGTGASSSNHESNSLTDNFRDIQAVGPHRTVYRSPFATSSCPKSCLGEISATCPTHEEPTEVKRKLDSTTSSHWTYSDQQHWHDFGLLEHADDIVFGYSNNECDHSTSTNSFPGESPINIEPAMVVASSFPNFLLSRDFDKARHRLGITNDGHTLSVIICGNNALDCSARAGKDEFWIAVYPNFKFYLFL
jgi:hypothetical protein